MVQRNYLAIRRSLVVVIASPDEELLVCGLPLDYQLAVSVEATLTQGNELAIAALQ